MRKHKLIAGVVIIAVLLGGCDLLNPYSDPYPYQQYGSAKWSSEDPEIVFYTSYETGPYSEGTFYAENTELPIMVAFEREIKIVKFYTEEEGKYRQLLRGEWILEPDKLVVEVTGGKEFKDQYEEIVFKRTVE